MFWVFPTETIKYNLYLQEFDSYLDANPQPHMDSNWHHPVSISWEKKKQAVSKILLSRKFAKLKQKMFPLFQVEHKFP